MRKIVLLLLLMTGCSTVIDSGDVYNKEFVPEHKIEVDDTTYIDVNGVTIPIISSHTETVPDAYYLDIRKVDEDSGKWRTRRIPVSPETYGNFQVGDPFSFNKP